MEIKVIKSINENYNSINIKNQLINLIIDSVANEGSIGFVNPLDKNRAESYWNSVESDLSNGCKILLVAIIDQNIVGTISLSWSLLLTNSKHRAEVQKLMVDSRYRGRGIAKQLINRIEELAIINKFKLLVLDTRASDPVTPNLYRKMGFIEVGDIPFFALDESGYHATKYFYKLIDNELKDLQKN